jgi:hypothetical protein
MGKIAVERNPVPARLKSMGVADWPVWNKEASEFS